MGVGGSGKQSLTRLAASVSGLDVFQIQLRKGYSSNDLRADLAQLYIKAGLKNIGTVFLLTDAQVPDEHFLVLINDLLASGEIPGLFPDEDFENIINGIRNEVKGAGLIDSRENCWSYFIDRVRRQLKVVLCFSPVGSTLRVRGRKFPALVNCTCIDWFHEWPDEALKSVSYRFLSEVELIDVSGQDSVGNSEGRSCQCMSVSSVGGVDSDKVVCTAVACWCVLEETSMDVSFVHSCCRRQCVSL